MTPFHRRPDFFGRTAVSVDRLARGETRERRSANAPAASPLSISVVLPVLMRAADRASVRRLRRALQSALDQEYPGALEIIVVDDGSPAPVRETMRRAGLPPTPALRWLRSDHNEGIAHALNTGIREARYGLIARLDADDRWLPGKIAAQVERFRDDPDLTLVATGVTEVDAKGWALEQRVRRDGWENVLEIAAGRGWCPFPHGSVVALASVYRLLGGYSHRYVAGQDYHLWSNWIRFFKPAVVERPLYEHRRTPGAISDVCAVEQRVAQQRIHRRLAAVVDWRTHPGDVRRLAGLLGVSLLQCGAICYRLWRFGPTVRMPTPAVGVLRRILPDRDVVVGDGGRAPVRPVEDLAGGLAGPAKIRSGVNGGGAASCLGGERPMRDGANINIGRDARSDALPIGTGDDG